MLVKKRSNGFATGKKREKIFCNLILAFFFFLEDRRLQVLVTQEGEEYRTEEKAHLSSLQ